MHPYLHPKARVALDEAYAPLLPTPDLRLRLWSGRVRSRGADGSFVDG